MTEIEGAGSKYGSAAEPMLNALLSEAREELNRADQKASILMAAATVSAASIISGVLGSGWRAGVLSPLSAASWWVGAALVLVGIGLLLWALFPRWRASGHTAGPYFGEVADAESLLTLDAVTAPTVDAYLHRIAGQYLQVARIARRKYVLIQAATFALGIGGLLSVTALVIG